MHDIRAVKFGAVPNGGEPWRIEHSVNRNGNLYPTHPLGPLAWWMDINRGDSFSYLVSMSSKSRSLKEFAAKTFGAERPARQDRLQARRRERHPHPHGDGPDDLRSITTPTRRAPRSTWCALQGTKGVFNVQMDKIFVDGRSNRVRRRESWRTAPRVGRPGRLP